MLEGQASKVQESSSRIGQRDSDSKSAFSEDDVKSEDDELEITHAKSLEVLIPQGHSLVHCCAVYCGVLDRSTYAM